MEKVLIDKNYILNRMEELKQSPALQEYAYLQGLLKQAETKPEEVGEEIKE